jgi:hypothetical protein
MNLLAFTVYTLAVTLHVQLLDVGSEFVQCLAVGNYGSGCVVLDAGSVKSDETEQKWNVFLS